MAAAVLESKPCKLNPLQRLSSGLSGLPRRLLSPSSLGKSTRESSSSELPISPADSPVSDMAFSFKDSTGRPCERQGSFDQTYRQRKAQFETHLFMPGAGYGHSAPTKLSLEELSSHPAALLLEEELERALMPHLVKRASSLREKEPSTSLQRAWYHGEISKDEATRLLRADGENGVFIIRTSETCVGTYVLSVLVLGHVTHIRILRLPNGSYLLTGAERNFPTLGALIANYSLNAFTMNGEGKDMHMRLKRPCRYLPKPCAFVPE